MRASQPLSWLNGCVRLERVRRGCAHLESRVSLGPPPPHAPNARQSTICPTIGSVLKGLRMTSRGAGTTAYSRYHYIYQPMRAGWGTG